MVDIYGDYQTSVIRAFNEMNRNWQDYDCLVITGSHNPKNTEFLIGKIKEARESGKPFYGECFGHQLAFIEYCRNVLGIKDATSEEFGQGTFVVRKRTDGINVGLRNGQSYWNNYEIDSSLGWEKPKNFFTAQYHASYQSAIGNFHPLLKDFLTFAKQYNR